MAATPAQLIPDSSRGGRPSSIQSRLRVARFAWGVLAYTVAVILWGSVVRATGSGNGCGDHWPLCNGTILQAHLKLATIIEYTHRMTSAITVLAVLALLFFTYRVTAKRHLARVAAVATVLLTLNEAFLGALLVLLKLTADNPSPMRALVLSLHLANTLLLLGALALAAHFLARREAFERRSVSFHSLSPVLLGLAATLIVGVTGSLAALGDTLFPATSLHVAFIEDFSRKAGWLLDLRILHPLCAIIAGAFILWLIASAVFRTNRRQDRNLGVAVLVLLGIQYLLGATDVLLLAPTWMQVLHLLGADVLWVTLIVLAARVSIRAKQAVIEQARV